MGDDRLRELERRWRESGAVEDEAAYLKERVRAGELASDRYALAAALGAEATGGHSDPVLGFQAWVESLPFRRKRGRVERDWARVPLAIAHAFEPCAIELGLAPFYPAFLAAADAVFFDGTPLEPGLRESLAELLYELHPDTWDAMPPAAAMTRFLALALCDLADPPQPPDGYEQLARQALYPEGVWAVEPGTDDAIEAVFPAEGGRLWRLRLAIRDALLPWVLGPER